MAKKTASQNRQYYFGWQPDLPDQRDHLYSAPRPVLAALPAKADLRPKCPPVYDQGQLGSCTANAISGAMQFALKKEGKPAFAPSRLFVYYNERSLEGHISTDSGAQLRDGVKVVNTFGVCAETLWPYDPSRFAIKPGADCYSKAKAHEALKYQRIAQDLSQMKGCLASGTPFVFGFSVYASFMTPAVAKSGVAPMPKPSEAPQGGHAVMAVGYDDESQRFIVRNSWGTGWGQKGYFTLPYLYLLQAGLASDFWAIDLVD